MNLFNTLEVHFYGLSKGVPSSQLDGISFSLYGKNPIPPNEASIKKKLGKGSRESAPCQFELTLHLCSALSLSRIEQIDTSQDRRQEWR